MTMLSPFLDSVARAPDRLAVIARDGRGVTYRELADRSAGLADRFRRAGIGHGDRVLVAVPVSCGLYAALIAVWRLGAVAVFPEPSAGLSGLLHAARTTVPKAWIAPMWLRALGNLFAPLRRISCAFSTDSGASALGADAGIADVSGDHPALISFTSGSTGTPKGIVRSHRLLLRQHEYLAPLLDPGPAGAVDLVCFPSFVLSGLALGTTSVLPAGTARRPDGPALRRQIDRHAVSRLLVPPSVCAQLTSTPAAASLRRIFSGGGPLFPPLLRALQEWAKNAEIVAVYGSTEAEPVSWVALSEIGAEDWAAMASGAGLLAGAPIPQIELAIVDDEIIVTGEHVNKSFLDPAHNVGRKVERGGVIWHRTGDAGRLDSRGRLWLLGRMEGRIGRLFPFGVECAALSWPGVAQTALIERDGKAILAIAGDRRCAGRWREEAVRLGTFEIGILPEIPLDRRHGSKVDYPGLRRALR